MRYKHILLHITEALTGAIERMVEEEKGIQQVEESHDPVGVSEESHDPVGVSEESHDPVGVSEESHDPMGGEGMTRRPIRPHFDKVFMISALTGDGVEDLRVRGS